MIYEISQKDWNHFRNLLKPVMGIRLFQENGSLSISPENLILYYFDKKKLKHSILQ